MHPLPEDISRASTYDIVERIRCEVREALLTFKDDPHAAKIISISSIGYDFVFDMTEGNHIKDLDKPNTPGAALKFQRPSFADKTKEFSLDLTARAEKTRDNIRRFRILEDLSVLNKPEVDCSNATTRENWVYPITGATGLGEVVSTFIRLEKLTNFSYAGSSVPDVPDRPGTGGIPGADFTIKDKAIVFSDVLKYTTNLSAGVKPTLTLRTIPGDLRLTNASLFASAERSDIHTLIVALASDPKGKPDVFSRSKGARARVDARAAVARASSERVVASGVLRESRTVTALVQKDETARTRILIELQRLSDLEEDDRQAPRVLGQRFLDILKLPP